MTHSLTGKVAVVTGASKGIGSAIAKELAANGATVVVNYGSSKQGAEAVVAAITAKGGKALAVQADISNPADISNLFETAAKTFGKIDILVNNAGIYAFSALEDITPEQFHSQFNLNVLGLLLSTQAAVKYFPETGGNVINISSAVTSLTPPNSAVYTATKGAVDAITRVLAKELGPRNIRVNAINPGMIETEGVHAAGFAGGDFRTWVGSTTPLGRIGQVADIAPAAAFLASEAAGYITGATFHISGGAR